jgi:hypothetical protein
LCILVYLGHLRERDTISFKTFCQQVPLGKRKGNILVDV